MRVLLVSLLLLAMPMWALADSYEHKDSHDMAAAASGDATAVAGDTAMAAGAVDVSKDMVMCGLKMPCTCQITCVNVDIACCWDCCECPGPVAGDLRVDFLCAQGTVLGSATLTGPWCDPCDDCDKFANLDKAVNPQDVCSVRMSWVGEKGINIKMFVLRVMSEDPCSCGGCGDWTKVFKCSPDCCEMLTAGQSWLLTQDMGCGCKDKCGCKSKGGDRCGDKCGCKSKCDRGCKDKCGCKSKCDSGCKTKCGCKDKCGSKCGDKCGCKSKCDRGCKDKCGCAKKSCGCKDKCNKCDRCNSCKTKCGCGW